MKLFTHSTIEAFHYSLSKAYHNGIETEMDPIHLQGLVFTHPYASDDRLVDSLFIPCITLDTAYSFWKEILILKASQT
jgi:hypothetical protein